MKNGTSNQHTRLQPGEPKRKKNSTNFAKNQLVAILPIYNFQLAVLGAVEHLIVHSIVISTMRSLNAGSIAISYADSAFAILFAIHVASAILNSLGYFIRRVNQLCSNPE